MTDYRTLPSTAFAGTRLIARGPLADVALAVQRYSEAESGPVPLMFSDETGKPIDLDLRGSAADIVERLAGRGEPSAPEPRGRGRPRLGVVAREVTLLPRHWDWLASQPGGASQVLRRLIDEARRSDDGQSNRRLAQERTYRFLNGLAGDLPGFEEACRALFAGDDAGFAQSMADWPGDVADHALALSRPQPPKD